MATESLAQFSEDIENESITSRQEEKVFRLFSIVNEIEIYLP
jgi:hypothetical protein